ncbi:hypothetical protein [Roseovarius sp. D0-M9]|uniref:hypothetical protein n=1 Tax=Roseovarius sp. D0-M9 TaxID=3127117 RepID=UPI00300FABFD
MKIRIAIAAATLVTVAACAPRPDQIAAVEVGSNEYRGYSCAQLSDAELRYTQALTNLSASQNRAASGDAWGVFLLGLPISSMSGADNETKIAVTKGHIQSIEREKVRKNC